MVLLVLPVEVAAEKEDRRDRFPDPLSLVFVRLLPLLLKEVMLAVEDEEGPGLYIELLEAPSAGKLARLSLLLIGVRAVRPSSIPAPLVKPEMVFLRLCDGVKPLPDPVPVPTFPVIPGVAPAPNPGPSKLSKNSLSSVNSFPPAESPPNPLPPPS